MHASSSRPTECGNSQDCSCSSMLTNIRPSRPTPRRLSFLSGLHRACCRPPPALTWALADWLRSRHASCRPPTVVSMGLSPSVPILGRPLAIRPGLDRGYSRPSPAPTALLVHPGFRPGLPPFIPGLGGLLSVRLRPRPGLLYCLSPALAGLSPPASSFERSLRRPSPTSEGFSPVFPVFDLASSRHSGAKAWPLAVPPRPRVLPRAPQAKTWRCLFGRFFMWRLSLCGIPVWPKMLNLSN